MAKKPEEKKEKGLEKEGEQDNKKKPEENQTDNNES